MRANRLRVAREFSPAALVGLAAVFGSSPASADSWDSHIPAKAGMWGKSRAKARQARFDSVIGAR